MFRPALRRPLQPPLLTRSSARQAQLTECRRSRPARRRRPAAGRSSPTRRGSSSGPRLIFRPVQFGQIVLGYFIIKLALGEGALDADRLPGVDGPGGGQAGDNVLDVERA